MSRRFPAELRTTRLRAALCALACLLWAAAATAEDFMPLDSYPQSTLEIRSQAGRHWFKVYVASTQAQQMQGLMMVRNLPADAGMLFPQETPREMTMWMKNTLIPLDMLFIDARGRIVCIRARTEPESLDLIHCANPVKGVLEIGGGQAATRGIKVGDLVVHPSLAK